MAEQKKEDGKKVESALVQQLNKEIEKVNEKLAQLEAGKELTPDVKESLRAEIQACVNAFINQLEDAKKVEGGLSEGDAEATKKLIAQLSESVNPKTYMDHIRDFFHAISVGFKKHVIDNVVAFCKAIYDVCAKMCNKVSEAVGGFFKTATPEQQQQAKEQKGMEGEGHDAGGTTPDQTV
ncbi:MAG: hypothetical protein K0U37_08030 [Gammaproteobacteria bacterium]|nr:hypothetical protein [Gammaproteobacteria bacterium]